MFRNMNRAKYDTFDPDKYDPSLMRRRNNADNAAAASAGTPGSAVKTAQPGNKMQINLSFANPTASDLTFEVWNYLDSCTSRLRPEYVVGNYLYIPQTSYQGIKAIAAATDQTVGFDQVGSLVIRGLLANPVATLSCKEIAYDGFFKASGLTPFEVAYMRYKASIDAQIDENIDYFQKTFSGGEMKNTIDPRAYQLPSNLNELLIDITVSYSIGADKGLRMKVLAGQTVKLSLFIVGWTLQTLS